MCNRILRLTERCRRLKPDLNAFDVAAAVKSVKGTARSMGVEVVG